YRAFSGPTELYAWEIARDARGRVDRRTERVLGEERISVHGDDAAGRLARVEGSGSIETFEYDDNGNLIARTRDGRRIEARYDDGDRILSSGDDAFEHSAGGDLLVWRRKGESLTFRWSSGGDLVGVDHGERPPIDYVLDPEGARVGKKGGGSLVRGLLRDAEG